jgi:hypothetical protein
MAWEAALIRGHIMIDGFEKAEGQTEKYGGVTMEDGRKKVVIPIGLKK